MSWHTLLAAFYVGGAVAAFAQRVQSYHMMTTEERQRFREDGRPGFGIAVETVGWPAFAVLILGWYGLRAAL